MNFFIVSPKNLVIAACLASTLLLASASILSDNGKAGRTGSPNETTCNTSGCHTSFALNSGGGSVTITSNPAMTNNQYVPGTAYIMSVTVSRTGSNLFGLGVEVLTATNTNAGTLAITRSNETYLSSSGGRNNVVHKLNGGLAANSKSFEFKWTAPASGSAKFYVAGAACNNNGSESGDYIYTTTTTFTPAPATSLKTLDADKLQWSVYPNPAQNNFTTSYLLEEAAQVKGALYSLQGALIANVIDEKQAAGTHKILYRLPENISAGTYFFKLSVGHNSVVKKIVIS